MLDARARRRVPAGLAFAVAASLLPTGSAACYAESPEVTLPTPLGTYYVDESCDERCFLSIWVYEESNGIPGLQRDDDMRTTCDAGEPADMQIF